jgi:hypothetical protein
MISQDASHAARKVFVASLGTNDMTEYTKDSVRYRMTLPPAAKLTIDCLPRDVRGGFYWLVTAEPVRAPRDN